MKVGTMYRSANLLSGSIAHLGVHNLSTMKKSFTKEEVTIILREVYDCYEIWSSKKFQLNHLNNFSDEPPLEKVNEEVERDIESFIY